METLEIQKLLRAGTTFEQIERKFGIKARPSLDGKLVNMKYSQIDSDKHLRVVQECRGILLEQNTWNIVGRGFERFFNYTEDVRNWDQPDFDSDNLGIFEKVDGSIITVFNYGGEWRLSTSGVIDGTSNVNGGIMTFRELFERGADRYDGFWDRLDTRYTYVFELISPLNRVVTEYDTTDLRLLSMRYADDSRELNWDEILTATANIADVPKAKRFDFNGLEAILKGLSEVAYKDEGFVIVDFNKVNAYGCFARLKMKCAEYVRLHHLKDSVSSSPRRLVEVVLLNEGDEVKATFPELKVAVEDIEVIYTDYKKSIGRAWNAVAHLCFEAMSTEEIATYAKEVISNHKAQSWILFRMRSEGVRDVQSMISTIVASDKDRSALLKNVTELYTNTLK
jgi:T4 RnlA family RNA ligase